MSYILSELIKGVSKVQRELVYQLCNKFMLHLIHFSHCFRWYCIEHWPFAYQTIICNINQMILVSWFWFRFQYLGLNETFMWPHSATVNTNMLLFILTFGVKYSCSGPFLDTLYLTTLKKLPQELRIKLWLTQQTSHCTLHPTVSLLQQLESRRRKEGDQRRRNNFLLIQFQSRPMVDHWQSLWWGISFSKLALWGADFSITIQLCLHSSPTSVPFLVTLVMKILIASTIVRVHKERE